MADVTYLEALRQGLWEEMDRDPRVFILGEDVGAYGGAFKVTEGFTKKFGEARLAREGKDLSIVTYGATVWKSLEAADQLAKDDGLAVEVLDLRTLLPMDDAAIMRTVQKTNKVLIVHEDTRTGGLAGEIAARINEQAFPWLDGPIMRVTAHDVPLPYAPTLEDFVLPQTEDIVKAARWLAAY